jgi:transposase
MSCELHTLITSSFPSACPVSVTRVTRTPDVVRLQLTTTAPTACCPDGAESSSAVHSRYQRQLTDLPWGTRAVHLQLTVRKFVCRQPTCARRIFTERLPELVAPSARKTTRLVAVLRAIGIALGGQAGARLAARLHLPSRSTTLLRLVRAALVPPTPTLQAVGVDEWAWRRGRRFGTIVVDLASHRVVDLLPERSAAAVGAWLARHPSITVVCRDRSPLYADAIGRGGPEAVQVVDRFHLVDNLREALEAYLQNHRATLQAAAACTAPLLTPPGSLVPTTSMSQGRRRRLQTPQGGSEEAARPHRHTPWVTIYETLHALHAQGLPIATIARQLGISRPTVYAYLRRTTPPGPKRPQFHGSARVLTPYVPYLIRRWRESGANSAELWREIRVLGYTHSARTVCRFIMALRRASEAGLAPEAQASPYTRPSGPSPRAVSFTLVRSAAKRSPEAAIYVEQLCQPDPGVTQAYALSHAFLVLVRERRGEALEAWITEAADSGIAAVARFARGLQVDLPAIKAGLTLAWSNGVTEGQIHRLKLVKRQGYGRAGFALLRQRVWHAA